MTTTDKTDAQILTEIVVTLLEHYGLDFSLLNGQGYDGAANISGQYSGLLERIYTTLTVKHYIYTVMHMCLILKLQQDSNLSKKINLKHLYLGLPN